MTTRQQVIGPEYQAFEALSVSTSSVGLTAGTILDRQFALITVEVGAVRFRLDGTAPTAAVGHVLEPGDKLTLDSNDQLASVRFIRRDGLDATLECSYGR